MDKGYSELIAHVIYTHCVLQPNVSALADAVDETTSRVWHYARGKRKWDASVWLKVLAAAGALTVRNDGAIVIEPTATLLFREQYLKELGQLLPAPGARTSPLSAEGLDVDD